MKPSTTLEQIISGCKKGKHKYQKMLYEHFYGYAMAIALRYAQTQEDALEILNDAFIKIFEKINKQDSRRSFKSWLGRIVVNTAIDHYRKNKKFQFHLDLEAANSHSVGEDIHAKLSAQEIIALLQRLPTSYRVVFNLYVLEGYSHKEIGEKLGIAASTSRSNLAVANAKMRAMLKELMLFDQTKKTS